MDINDFIKDNPEHVIEEYRVREESFIYFVCEDNGEIIYIGSTMNPQARFKHHYTRVEFYNKPIFLFNTPTGGCLKLERKLIKEIRQEYNIQWKVDYYTGCMGRKKGQMGSERKMAANIKKQTLKIMEEKDISHAQLGEKLKVSRQRIFQILYDKKSFHQATIRKLEKALGTKFK